jgi:Tol biopolymer transport system component
MRSLAAAGDRTGAVKHARLYQELVRQELEIEPNAEIERLAASINYAPVAQAAVSHALEQPPDPSRFTDTSAEPPSKSPATPSIVGKTLGGKSRRRERMALYAVIPIAILMTGAAIWGWMRPSPSKQVVRYILVVDSTQAITSGEPWSGRLALSPDGSRLAYIGGRSGQLLIRPRSQLLAAAVPGTEGASTPFFSPNGSQVGYLEERKVRIVSLSGGSPISVSDTLTGVAGASWGSANSIYVDGSGRTGLLRVEAEPGSRPSWFTVLDTASGEYDHTWPDVLPNGKGVLFTIAFNGRNGAQGKTSYAIAVADIPSGKHRILVEDAMYARYSKSGHLLYVTTNKKLMFVPFDQNSLEVTGEPTVLSEGMRLGQSGSADLAVSATGTLVYTTGAWQGNHELVWVTRDGTTQPVDPDWQGGFLYFPALSPNGNWVAVARSNTTEPVNIWIKRLDRGQSRKLTFEGRNKVGPAWTPDGRSVTYSSEAVGGAFDLWTKRADGGGKAMLQVHEKRSVFSARWSADGKWLVFQTDPTQPGAGDILALRPGIDSAPIPLVATRLTEVAPALSPDGRWLAYTSNETGRFETYVVPFPNVDAARWAISVAGGTEPLWSHRGSELFYRDASQNFVAVEVKTRPTFSLGRSTVLFSAAPFDAYNFAALYAVAADDRRFMMSRPAETSTPDRVIVVDNWFEEVRAKARR